MNPVRVLLVESNDKDVANVAEILESQAKHFFILEQAKTLKEAKAICVTRPVALSCSI